jgi:c-di-GMP-binding flagellar brake protein YcgR
MSSPNGTTIKIAPERPEQPPDERRQLTRYKLRDARGVITWDEGSEKVECEVELLNISGGGAALLASRAAVTGSMIRLQIGCNPALIERVDARLLAASSDPSGRLFVRLQFTQYVSLDAILARHQERRMWERYPVRETSARLTRLENGLERTIRGELSNLSGGGAAVIVDDFPSADEARLVVLSLDPSGSKIARFKFLDSCPMALFQLAINGGD